MARLTDRQQNARAKAAGGYITFNPTSRNPRGRYFYASSTTKEIEKFLEQLNREIDLAKTPTELRAVFEKFNNSKIQILEKNAEKISVRWMKINGEESKRFFEKALSSALGVETVSISYGKRTYDNLFKDAIQRNVNLITNVARQSLTNLESVVYDAVTHGRGSRVIKNYIQEQEGISKRRAKFIARDQTAKANGAINELAQQDAGLRFFEWQTAKDERVSTGIGGHAQLQGKIYAWDEPESYPVIDSQGNVGLPGKRPNCRCVALPVVLKNNYEARKNPDGSYRIIKGRY